MRVIERFVADETHGTAASRGSGEQVRNLFDGEKIDPRDLAALPLKLSLLGHASAAA
jgi:hypothetical protein